MSHSCKLYLYTVYGLNIESAIKLPDLAEAECRPNVKIRFGKLQDEFLDEYFDNSPVYQRPGCRVRVSERAMFFEWARIGRVLVREGCEVIVAPEPDVSEEDLLPFLTGPALSVLLHQRGLLVLHASAVAVGDSAVAFLGAKGYGKSTLAAHLQVKGHKLISDDIVPVNFTDNAVETVPGYPKVKLYADSVTAVGSAPSALPYIHRFVDKHSFHCPQNFSIGSVRLSGIYILAENESVGIKKLDLKTAFIEAAKYTHVNRYLEQLNSQARHFEQWQRLVHLIPFFELRRPHEFERINEVSTLIEKHALEISAQRKYV